MQPNVMAIYFVMMSLICLALLWRAVFIDNQEKPAPSKKQRSFSYRRVNDVEGELTVNGKKMKTYNIGELHLDDLITLRFYNGFHTDVRVTDIFVQGKSVYVFAPSGDWKKKAEYSVSVLKQMVNAGSIPAYLVSEVEDILLEVETLNRYIENGKLIRTHDESYAWVF